MWQLKKQIHDNRKRIVLVSALFLLAIFGVRLFDLFYVLVLSAYNVHLRISITEKTQIDFYGALIPTTFSLLTVLYLVYFQKLSIKYYLANFLFAIAFAFSVSTGTSNAIVTLYKVLAFLVSIWVVFVAFYDKGIIRFLKFRDIHSLKLTRKNYFIALLISFSYASLSVLILDLTALPFSTSMYIGAMGLTDGIMLSGLFTPISTTIVTLFVMFISEMTP